MTKTKDRIPYEQWINSQLSVAKYYGACTINGDRYECDYDNCPTKIDEDGTIRYFPDLVKVKKDKT